MHRCAPQWRTGSTSGSVCCNTKHNSAQSRGRRFSCWQLNTRNRRQQASRADHCQVRAADAPQKSKHRWRATLSCWRTSASGSCPDIAHRCSALDSPSPPSPLLLLLLPSGVVAQRWHAPANPKSILNFSAARRRLSCSSGLDGATAAAAAATATAATCKHMAEQKRPTFANEARVRRARAAICQMDTRERVRPGAGSVRCAINMARATFLTDTTLLVHNSSPRFTNSLHSCCRRRQHCHCNMSCCNMTHATHLAP